MYPAMKRIWLWSLFLFLCLTYQGHTQEALAVYPEDLFIEEAPPDQAGFHLFIRKKPGISSVLLMESTKDPAGQADSYAYRGLDWNEINGGWALLDSTPEKHPLLGEAFHIYIPPTVTYGFASIRYATLPVEEGFYMNIRSFARPDYSGEFKDNPFTLTPLAPPDVSSPPQLQFLPSDDLEAAPPPVPDLLPLPVEETSPDPPESPDAGQETPAPEPEPPPAPEAPVLEPEAEGFAFAPVIYAWGGTAIFFPGPEGRSLTLKNNYDPTGDIILTNWFTHTWGIHLGFDRDPILMNRLVARVAWNIDFIGFEAGPYFGLLNSNTGQVSPGLSLVLHARIPRWNLFSSFQWDSPFGRALTSPGDYIQSASEIKAGLSLPFGRLILSQIDRNSTVRDGFGVDITGHWIRYNLAAEIALPSLDPWEFQLDLGYQRFQWTYYLNSQQPLNYGYYNIYAGLGLSFQIKSFTLLFGMEAPLYPFAYPQIESLTNPQAPFFGQINLGVRWAAPSR
jgi:hypothetical protein